MHQLVQSPDGAHPPAHQLCSCRCTLPSPLLLLCRPRVRMMQLLWPSGGPRPRPTSSTPSSCCTSSTGGAGWVHLLAHHQRLHLFKCLAPVHLAAHPGRSPACPWGARSASSMGRDANASHWCFTKLCAHSCAWHLIAWKAHWKRQGGATAGWHAATFSSSLCVGSLHSSDLAEAWPSQSLHACTREGARSVYVLASLLPDLSIPGDLFSDCDCSAGACADVCSSESCPGCRRGPGMRRSRWSHPFRRQLAVGALQSVSPACICDDSACASSLQRGPCHCFLRVSTCRVLGPHNVHTALQHIQVSEQTHQEAGALQRLPHSK